MISDLLFSGAVRATIVLAIGLLAYALAARAAAATRRLVLVLALAAALVVPVAAAVGPRWTLPAPTTLSHLAHEAASEGARRVGLTTEAVNGARPASAGASEHAAAKEFDTASALARAWLAVAAALLLRAVASQLKAHALARRAVPVESPSWVRAAKRAAVAVKASSELGSPAVVGLVRPTVIIPSSALGWSLERCRLVLAHELAHVRRRDVLAQAVADVACAVHWYNPLAWICARRLRLEREIAADDAVLEAGVHPSRYAEELVAVATASCASSAILAMAERSSLETRIASILSARLARAPLAARGTAATVAVAAALAAGAACTSPEVSLPSRVAGRAIAPVSGTANDAAIQRAADEELAAIAKEWSPERATILVLDPATGEILANAGESGGKTADIASSVAMAPGSTLKPITVAAALEQRAITPDQTFACGPDPRTYGDKTLADHRPDHAGETLDVAHIVAVSSNVGMSRVFDALGGDNLGTWLHRFHFGQAAGAPDAATGEPPARVATGSFEGAMLATGEGLTATPLQMIAAYGAIASEGVYRAPHFDRGLSSAERLVSPETARAVLAMLETAVVDPAATGGAARVEGLHVVGKTGTADWTAPGGHERTYASFIGVADLPTRRIVALVGIEASPRDDLYGGNSAAPAFARLVKHIRGS